MLIKKYIIGKNIFEGGKVMKKDNKIIKFLETVAILILIASFIILAYCVYISFRTEQDVLGNYDAKKTAAEINEKNEINISETIEKIP